MLFYAIGREITVTAIRYRTIALILTGEVVQVFIHENNYVVAKWRKE